MTDKEFQNIVKREERDDHLTTEERRKCLIEWGVPFTEETLDEVFIEQIF